MVKSVDGDYTADSAKAGAHWAFQSNDYATATALCREALQLDPDDAESLYLLSLICEKTGQCGEAAALLRRLIGLNVVSAEICVSAGNILHRIGFPDHAITAYERAIGLKPAAAELYFNLANANRDAGRLTDACRCYERSLRLNQNYLEAHNNYVNLLMQRDELDSAWPYAEKALALAPKHPVILLTYANLAYKSGKLKKATGHYRKALEVNPRFSEAHSGLGNILREQGQIVESVYHCRRATELNPGLPEAWLNLGNALRDQDDYAEAAGAYANAIGLTKNYIECHVNLSHVCLKLDRINEAVYHGQKAIRLNAENADAHNNLANALVLKGDIDSAITHYKKALKIEPRQATTFSNFLLCLNYIEASDLIATYDRHCEFSRVFEEKPSSRIARRPDAGEVARKLRIGYVSPDFYNHSVAFFIRSVLKQHNKDEFEIYCYSNRISEDSVSEELRNLSDGWRSIATLSNDEAKRLVQDDGIDILVDLTGHTAGNRLLLFAERAAPVQVTWLGYLNTTGLKNMDYRITDVQASPRNSHDRWHSEELVRLSCCQWCYTPPEDAPEVGPLPAFSQGYITFASFHNMAKIGPKVIETWAAVLNAVPTARLVMASRGMDEFADEMRTRFEAYGVEGGRLELLGQLPLDKYLELHNRIDINLDAFPYTGGTTTCHSLWMGVPVITLTGTSTVARGGASILHYSGLDDFISHSHEEYIQIAANHAENLETLSRVRSGLRERFSGSLVMDAQTHCRELEKAYLEMWQKSRGHRFEPPRVLRRLQHLREWSHEQIKQVFPRGPGAGGADGTGAPWGISVVVGGRGVDGPEDRLRAADVAGVGQASGGRC